MSEQRQHAAWLSCAAERLDNALALKQLTGDPTPTAIETMQSEISACREAAAALTAAAERETKLREENERLKADLGILQRSVAFNERTYLASHGGSWGKCKYQGQVEAAESALAAERQKVQALRECIQHNARDAKIILRWFDEHGLTPDPPRAEP